MNKILMVVLNTFVNDARVSRMATTLSEHYDVSIFARHAQDLPKQEKFGDVTVQRHSVSADHAGWAFLRPLRYVELLVRFIVGAVRMKPTVVHAHDLNALPIGYLISRLTGAKLIYDAHEMWSEQEIQNSLPRYIRVIGRWFEKRYSRRADAAISVSEGIADEMQRRFNLEKVNVVRNLPSHHPVDRSESPLRRHLAIDSQDFIVLYQGALSSGRGVECLIEAFLQLDDPRLQLVLLGNGPLKADLEEAVPPTELNSRVHFISAVPHAELLYWTAGADTGVHPMVGSCLNHKLALPNKLFEYLQAGLPIIVSDMPEMATFVRKEKIGLVFEDGNAEELARNIAALSEDHDLVDTFRAEARRVAAIENWENESQKLSAIYTALTEGTELPLYHKHQ